MPGKMYTAFQWLAMGYIQAELLTTYIVHY